MAKLINTVGPPVEGDDRFWDRAADIEMLSQRLDEGNHILLVAQRRMGKTSLLREVARRLQDRYICLSLDLQKHESAAEVVAALAAATHPHANVWRRTKAVFGSIAKAVDERIDSVQISEVTVQLRAGLAGDDWRAKGDAVFQVLAEAGDVVLMMDEVPILINRMLKGEDHTIRTEGRRDADLFLSWLRDNALRHSGKVRLVVSGSIGLTPVLRRTGLSATANYLMTYELPPWDESTAIACLEALARSYGLDLSPEVCEHMVSRIGCCIPHHVQSYFDLAFRYCKRHGKTILTKEDAERVYLQDMLGPRGNTELAHYEERLYMVLGRELGTLAIALLTSTSVKGALQADEAASMASEYVPDGSDAEESLRMVLEVLQHDGYVRPTGGGYRFVSRLLCDWWRDRFATPFSQARGKEGK